MILCSGNLVQLYWHTIVGQPYDLDFRNTFLSPWQKLYFQPLIATNETLYADDFNNAESGFYRIGWLDGAKCCSGQQIISIATSEFGRYPDEVGKGLGWYPYELSRYISKTGTNIHDYEAWCSEFVSWTYAAAGYPFAKGSQGGWMFSGNQQIKSWFAANRRFISKNDPEWFTFIPQPGDYIRFDNSAGGHSAIVRSVNHSILYIVHGNSGNQVRLSTITDFRNSSSIDGIGLRLANDYR
jgi:hypothetical protein